MTVNEGGEADKASSPFIFEKGGISLIREPEGMDIPRFMGLLEEWKGDGSWLLVSKKCGVDHSVISRIKSGNYCPGYRTIMKLSRIAPTDYQVKLYNELLEAAGLCGPYVLRKHARREYR